MPVRASMVIGLPHTTYESTRVAMENMAKLGIHAEWYLATPFPGTEFYDYVMKHGRLLEDPLSLRALTFRRVVFDTPEFPKRKRYRAFYEAFAHYLVPGARLLRQSLQPARAAAVQVREVRPLDLHRRAVHPGAPARAPLEPGAGPGLRAGRRFRSLVRSGMHKP